MRMEDHPTKCILLICKHPQMISTPLSNLSVDWKLSEGLICWSIWRESFCWGESREFPMLTINVKQDAIHAENDGNKNLIR